MNKASIIILTVSLIIIALSCVGLSSCGTPKPEKEASVQTVTKASESDTSETTVESEAPLTDSETTT